MAASDHLNHDQLRMFMRPQEIINLVTSSIDQETNWDDETEDQPLEGLWNQKRAEVNRSVTWKYLKPSITAEGVKRPITIVPGSDKYEPPYMMGEGHHRVMAADEVEKETGKEVYIPVVHSRYWDETNDYNYSPDEEEHFTGEYKKHFNKLIDDILGNK